MLFALFCLWLLLVNFFANFFVWFAELLAKQFRKMRGQLFAPVAQSPFYGRQRQRQKGGDADGGPLLIIEQQQDDLAVGRKMGKQGAYGFLLLGTDYQVEGAVRAHIGRVGRKVVQAGGFDGSDAAFAFRHTQRPPSRNHAQPARELACILQLPQGAIRQQKRFLGHVLRHLQGADRLLGDKDHGVPKTADEFVIGFQTAPLRHLYQLAIRDKLETARHRHLSSSLLPI